MPVMLLYGNLYWPSSFALFLASFYIRTGGTLREGGHLSPPLILAYQLTLFKPGGGQIMPLILLLTPPGSKSHLHLWLALCFRQELLDNFSKDVSTLFQNFSMESIMINLVEDLILRLIEIVFLIHQCTSWEKFEY